jgi:hypothetical protein
MPAGPLEVPEREVGAVKPLWPARLQPAPRPPPPAAAYQQCSVAALTSQSHKHRRFPQGVKLSNSNWNLLARSLSFSYCI